MPEGGDYLVVNTRVARLRYLPTLATPGVALLSTGQRVKAKQYHGSFVLAEAFFPEIGETREYWIHDSTLTKEVPLR